MTDAEDLESAARAALADASLAGWNVHDTDDGFFRVYEPPGACVPEAGTKLHVSSSVACAPGVLRACLPVLVRHGVAFKHVTTLRGLSFLSTGRGGAFQVGKFVTAYPATGGAADLIASALHEATAGFSGPRVPDEEPFEEGSLVHSRDGAFTRRWIQLPTGGIVPGRRTEDGWAEDRRGTGAGDPSGRPVRRVLRGRYVRMNCLFRSPKGRTDVAVLVDAGDDRGDGRSGDVSGDVSGGGGGGGGAGGSFVVVKEAYAHTMEELSGRDARSRLAAEAACLAELGGPGVAPRLVDHWEEPSSAFLVYEPVVGRTLSAVIRELAGRGQRLPAELVRAWTRSLAETAARAHDAGWVIADIKPSNIVVTATGPRLIDFELAGPPTSEPVGGMGTRGYCSPQQADPLTGRSCRDDVYAIGATALAMVTGTEASVLPDLGRVAALEARRTPADPVHRVIARCLETDPGRRFASARQISRALDRPAVPPAPRAGDGSAVTGNRSGLARHGIAPTGDGSHAAPADGQVDDRAEGQADGRAEGHAYGRAEATAAAVDIGVRLLGGAVTESGRYTYWLSGHRTVNRQPSHDLYSGSGGIALFLCALAEATGRPDFLDAATRCGHWIAETAPAVPRTEPMPGLYFGDCGAALLYVRLARATGDPAWLDRARAIAEAVDPVRVRSPDLMTGLAGVGLLHLALCQATGDPAALRRAGDCAAELSVRRDPDRPVWRLPDDFGALSGARYLGYSHGSAGIGRFLAEYASVAGDEPARRMCAEIAGLITGTAKQGRNDGTGVYWTFLEGSEASAGATWCHGTAGMARFLLHAYGLTGAPEHLATAVAAIRTTAAARWLGTSQCHGLAGSIELLIDTAHATGDAGHLTTARSLAADLRAYRTPDGWPSDEGSPGSPDLMVGEAGVGAALLRLAFPGTGHLIETAAPIAAPAGAGREDASLSGPG